MRIRAWFASDAGFLQKSFEGILRSLKVVAFRKRFGFKSQKRLLLYGQSLRLRLY